MTTLPELSRRVSEAEGPSRALDAEVMLFARPELAKRPYTQNRIGNWLRMDGRSEIVSAPPYTASLDAVANLIAEKLPGNWHWLAGHAGDALPGMYCGMIMPPGLALDLTVNAKTPALALLSATLLAIHERNKSDDKA